MATVSTDSTYTFTVTGNRSLTAVFEPVTPSYSIVVLTDPESSGTATGAGTYQQGASVTLTATVNDGYTFTGWQENGQTVSTDNPYTFTATADRTFTAAFAVASRLPEGYTEIEYITAKGYQGVNTKTKVNFSKTRIVMDIDAHSFSSGKEYFFIDLSSGFYCFLYRSSASKISYQFFNGPLTTISQTVIGRTRIDCNFATSTLQIQEKTYSILKRDSTQYGFFFLLGANTNTKAIPCNLYSAQIYESEELIRDYVPCINPDGVTGLYDLVNNEFYKNSVSGTFTPGPAI